MSFETVYTVWDYFDGPRSGLADYRGNPHYFVCNFDEAADGYSDVFFLAPIDDDTLQLALKQWAIWREWEDAFHAGEVRQESHPGFGGKSAAYDAQKVELHARLAGTQRLRHVARAEFRAAQGAQRMAPGMLRPLEVSWQDVT